MFLQDSIDLFLGNYAVEEADMNTPLHEPKDWKFLTVRERFIKFYNDQTYVSVFNLYTHTTSVLMCQTFVVRII